MNRLAHTPLALACMLALAGCSQSPAETDAEIAAQESAAATADDSALGTASAPTPSPADGQSAQKAAGGGRTLALEGLGDLAVGKPVPIGSAFAERGAQISDGCRTITAPGYPGVYAITDGAGGPVRRITVGRNSTVKLVEGIGIGSSEKEILAAFPGFRATPHKYVAAPGKYLTQPGSDPRLRFEIDEDGKVSAIHVGMTPELEYVEGCA